MVVGSNPTGARDIKGLCANVGPFPFPDALKIAEIGQPPAKPGPMLIPAGAEDARRVYRTISAQRSGGR